MKRSFHSTNNPEMVLIYILVNGCENEPLRFCSFNCVYLCLYVLQAGVEIPMDSDDADEENKKENGKTLLHIFQRG
jgi:hypothetical protein